MISTTGVLLSTYIYKKAITGEVAALPLDAMEVEASSGGGIVTARMNGKKELLDLILAADAITPDDPELLQDLVIAAVNEAGRKVDAEVQQKTQGMMPGLKIPGLG